MTVAIMKYLGKPCFFFLNCNHDEIGYVVYPYFLNKYKIPALSASLIKRQFKFQF